MRRDFAASLAFAKQWEQAVAVWLTRRGWRVLPTYDFSGKGDDKAPKLIASDPAKSLVVPDLFASRAGVSRWVEVKWKTHAPNCNAARPQPCPSTGINRRLWSHYLEVGQSTGLPVWIVFVHEREREMRGADLVGLKEAVCFDYPPEKGTKMGPHGMIFFRWSALTRLATLDQIATEATAAPKPAA